MAKIEKYSEFAGSGCFIQGIGLLAPVVLGMFLGVFGFFFGLLVAVVFLMLGSAKANKLRCGHCKNPLHSKHVMICPSCGARFDGR